MTRLPFVLVSAMTALSASAFTASPLHTQSFGVRRHREPLTMASTSYRSEFDFEYDDDMPGTRRDADVDEESRRQRDEKFVAGDDLHMLRREVLAMRLELQEARRTSSKRRVRELETAIIKAQQVDAEFVYTVSLERMEAAEREGQFQEAEKFKQQAMEARSALPQFNLEGLWVGKYGDHGYEMINVTYAGDTLIAHKITGTKNVPKGQATFQVDLCSRSIMDKDEALEPIELADNAASQWGCKYLQRFSGQGQIAANDYQDSQWINGQLILVKEYFSFAWLPIGHQVFFGRPTPELILKLLKDDSLNQAGQSTARQFLEKCWEETEHLQDDVEVTGGPFNSLCQQDYYAQEGCFE